ncbi:protease modulator HflC [Massilia phyllosphaerae]|uniref:protease modulator HflC n=1 Tax=Massilia phyllosphaerae TaxID=3106034 RepID=UPI002B1CBFAC|nr:protease modulator HflC [Massilia sp. SGZ-792]
MNRLIAYFVATVAVVALAKSSTFVVDQHRFGVLDGVGGPRQVVTEPGLHVKLPSPLQDVVYLDKRLQTLDTADRERFATREKRELAVDAFVKWRIVDARQYLIALAGANADRGSEKMAQLVRLALTAEIARHEAADLIGGQRGAVADAVRQRVAGDARQLGIEVADVRLKRIGFPDGANTAVIDRMKAERVRMAAATRATGTVEAEQIRGDAERQRSELLAEAQRDAESIRGDGDAKAAQIYAQSFGKNPEFYRFYRSMEAYKATFKGRNDILVLDSNSEFFKYFKNPGSGK